MPIFNTRNPLEYLIGAGEIGLSGVTGAAGQLLGVPYGILKQIQAGEYGKPSNVAERSAEELAGLLTYQPKKQTSLEMAGLLGDALEKSKLPPILPELMPLSALAANPAARNAQIERGLSAAEKAIEPAVLRTLEKGGTNAQSLLDMVKGSQSPLTVFHGSPYKFDAFDASKIGSGEGAQAYGHGLYLAESPDVAKFYQPRDMDYENKLMELYKKAEKSQDYDSLSVLEDALTHSTPSELLATHGEKFKPLIDKIKAIEQKSGLYKVDLPDDQIAKMLDWDKPLSEQTFVQKALLNQDSEWKAYASQLDEKSRSIAEDMVLGKTPVFEGDEAAASWRALYKKHPDLDHNVIHDVMDKINPQTDNLEWMSGVLGGNAAVGAGVRGGGGADLYNSLGGGEAAASKLRELGIPGIRYLDEGSRGVGKGTSNFVVFPGNESLLNILERNDQPIKSLLKVE